MDTWLSDTINKAEKKGEIKSLLSLVKDGILTSKQAAERLGISVAKLKKESEKFNLNFDFASK
jgi:hypothetical protein